MNPYLLDTLTARSCLPDHGPTEPEDIVAKCHLDDSAPYLLVLRNAEGEWDFSTHQTPERAASHAETQDATWRAEGLLRLSDGSWLKPLISIGWTGVDPRRWAVWLSRGDMRLITVSLKAGVSGKLATADRAAAVTERFPI